MKRPVIQRQNQYLVVLIVFLCSIPSILAFLHTGFPQTDDGNWMIIRLSAFYEVLRGGEFPVRWLTRLNNGYGYPVANFLYPGFMYLGVPIAAITSSFVTTVKLLFAVSLISSSIGMYLWLRKNFSQWSSFIGSMIYLYAPYHLYDATTRGSLGEVLVLGLAPFVFWAIDRRSVGLTGILLGLLLISHNTLAILFFPVIIIYQLLQSQNGESFFKRWAGILLGAGFSCFFWVPAVVDLDSTVFSQIRVSDWAGYFADFHLIGVLELLIVTAGAFFIFIKKSRSLNENRVTVFFFIIVGLTVFLSSSLSKSLWEFLPVQFIQFPFRVLSLTIFASAMLCTWLIEQAQRKVIVGSIVLVIALVSTKPYLFPKGYDHFDEGYYSTNQASTTVKNEYMPKWVKEIPTAPSDKVSTEHAVLSDLVSRGSTISFIVQAEKKETIRINQMYFPGWKVRVDNHVVPVSHANSLGVMEIVVPEGEHLVRATFEETPLRLFVDLISLLCLGILCGFLIREVKQR